MPTPRPTAKPRLDPRPEIAHDDLWDAAGATHGFYQSLLSGEGGVEARCHLMDERKLPASLVRSEEIGCLPKGYGHTVGFATTEGLSLEAMAEVGVVSRSVGRSVRAFQKAHPKDDITTERLSAFFREHLADDADYYYDFPLIRDAHGRPAPGRWVVLPIHARDPKGDPRVAGFQYRSLLPGASHGDRYRFIRENPLYRWSEQMIGLESEMSRVQETGLAVVAEGAFDRLALKAALEETPEASRPGVLALGGVQVQGGVDAGTSPWDRVPAERVILFLDGDEGGAKGTVQHGGWLEARGVDVSAVRIQDVWSDGDRPKDPGKLLETGRPAAILSAMREGRRRDTSTYAAAWLADNLRESGAGGTMWERRALLRGVLPLLQRIPAERSCPSVPAIARALSIDEAALRIALGAAPSRPGIGTPKTIRNKPLPR